MAGTNPRVTITDVAAASGVSRATVSFVLRDSPGQSISASTRERVRQAARDLGYVPHGIARALREGTSRVVVLTIDPVLDGNYARSYVAGLDAELAGHGHMLLVRYTHGAHADDTAPPDDTAPASSSAPASSTAPEPDQQLIDALSPRAVLRFGAPYLTGHELDDSGGGWRDGLAAHVAAQARPPGEPRPHPASRWRCPTATPAPRRQAAVRRSGGRRARPAAAGPGHAAGITSHIQNQSYRTDPADSLSRFPRRQPGDNRRRRLRRRRPRCASSRPCASLGPEPRLADLAVIGFDDNGYGALTSPR